MNIGFSISSFICCGYFSFIPCLHLVYGGDFESIVFGLTAKADKETRKFFVLLAFEFACATQTHTLYTARTSS